MLGVRGGVPRPRQRAVPARGRGAAGVAGLQVRRARDAGPPQAHHGHARRHVGNQDGQQV